VFYLATYFTFGVGQKHAGCIQPINSDDSNKARAKMFEVYGPEWSMEYPNDMGEEIIARYGLKVFPMLEV